MLTLDPEFSQNGQYSFQPNENYNGTDSFSYTVTDSESGERAVQTVTITVDAVNDAPKATFTTAQAATEDAAAISGQLTSTDADTTAQVNATTAEYSLVGDAISGLTLNTDGSWSFDASGTAYQDLSEGDTRAIDVNYLVTDDQDATGTATFTVTDHGYE